MMAKKSSKTEIKAESKKPTISKKSQMILVLVAIGIVVFATALGFLVNAIGKINVAAVVRGEKIKKSALTQQIEMAETLKKQQKVYLDHMLQSENISQEDYDAQIKALSSSKSRKETLESMVTFKVVELAAKENGVYVDLDTVIAKEKETIASIRKLAESGENESVTKTWEALTESVSSIDLTMDEYIEKVLAPSQHRADVYTALKSDFVDTLSNDAKKDPNNVTILFDAYVEYLLDKVEITYYE